MPGGGSPGTPVGIGGVRYMPSLDGLRAVAVLLVMAYHSGLSFLPAGFFGVDAFFVLSGFLITTLLLTEAGATRRIRLSAFWARRARRLLPALVLMVLAVVLFAHWTAAAGTYPKLRWDSLSSLFYSANWWFIVSNHNYFVQTGPVTPLLHTWSLAIEEQFYIVWPLLVLLAMRAYRSNRRRMYKAVLFLSAAGAVASVVEMTVLFGAEADVTRLYFGTDTHSQSLLVGCALAAGLLLWRDSRADRVDSMRSRRIMTATALLGAGIFAWGCTQLQYGQAVLFRGGFLLVAASVATVIACCVLCPTNAVGKILSWRPLRFIGRISYGMYLWHFPLGLAITGARTGLSGVPLFLVRAAATVAVSLASFYGLEMPIRSGRFLRAPHARVAAPATVVAMTALITLSTSLPVQASSTATVGRAGHPTSKLAPGHSGDLSDAPVRVLLVGDSVAKSLGEGLIRAESAWNMRIVNRALLGCGVALGTWTRGGPGNAEVKTALPCRPTPEKADVPWPQAWPNWLREVKPNVVVLLAGRWESVDRLYNGRWTNILDPNFAAYVKSMLETAVRIGTSTGAHMVLLTQPCHSVAELPNGLPDPGGSTARVEAYNQLVEAVAKAHPGTVTVEDLFSMVCPKGQYSPDLNGRPLRAADGVHFSAAPHAGARLLAPALLPIWQELGHEQESAGGQIQRGPLPSRLSRP